MANSDQSDQENKETFVVFDQDSRSQSASNFTSYLEEEDEDFSKNDDEEEKAEADRTLAFIRARKGRFRAFSNASNFRVFVDDSDDAADNGPGKQNSKAQINFFRFPNSSQKNVKIE